MHTLIIDLLKPIKNNLFIRLISIWPSLFKDLNYYLKLIIRLIYFNKKKILYLCNDRESNRSNKSRIRYYTVKNEVLLLHLIQYY